MGNANVNWHLLKQDLLRVSSEVLCCGREFQPDWFLESKSELEPLLAVKRDAHARMLACDTPVTRAASVLPNALLVELYVELRKHGFRLLRRRPKDLSTMAALAGSASGNSRESMPAGVQRTPFLFSTTVISSPITSRTFVSVGSLILHAC